MNKKKLQLALTLLPILLLSLFLPVSADIDTPIPQPDHLRVATFGAPETVDPHWAYDTASALLIQNVYEGLVTFDHESVEIVDIQPNLADSWLIEDTVRGPATKWTFTIGSGITFQNDAALTPSDVEYSFERGMIMDHRGGPMWMLYEPLTGAFTSRQWDLADDGDVTELGLLIDNAIESTSTTVVFNLAIPYAPFMQILAQSWSMILDKDWAIGQGCWDGVWGPNHRHWLAWNNPLPLGPLDDPDPVMMGTGPYEFVHLVEWPDKYELTAWTNGYRGGWPAEGFAGYISTVHFENIEEWTTRKLLFLRGDVDMVAVPRPNMIDLFTNWPPKQPTPPIPEEYAEGIRCVKDLPTLAMSAIFFGYDVEPTSPYVPKWGNGTSEPTLLSDINLRRAFAYALNRTQYIIEAMMGEGIVPPNPIIEGLPYRNPDAPSYYYDLAKVEENLKAAWDGQLWTEGINLIVTYNTGNEPRRIAAEMIEYVMEYYITWPGTATVDITVRGVPWATYIPDLYGYNLGAYVIGWLADYPDPHNWVSPYMHEYGDFSMFMRVEYGQSGHMQKLPWGDPTKVIDNAYVNGLIEDAVKIDDTTEEGIAERQAIYYELQDIYYYECGNFPVVQAYGRHWERDWVQGWYYNTITPWSTGPSAYYYHIWKGLDADMAGGSSADGRVDVLDGTAVSYNFWNPPFMIGPAGEYTREADIAPVSEQSGEDYIIPGADGLVDIEDFLAVHIYWHWSVVPV